MNHFDFSASPKVALTPGRGRAVLRESVLPMFGQMGLMLLLVAAFALVIYTGHDHLMVFEPHVDGGEETDGSLRRFLYMLIAFVASFGFAAWADRLSRKERTWAAYWVGGIGGTLLWQSVGESSWHFSVIVEDAMVCFPRLESVQTTFVIIPWILLMIYAWKKNYFSWGMWAFILVFMVNWFGHYAMIGTLPLVNTIFSCDIEEAVWYRWIGGIGGGLCALYALYIAFVNATDLKGRLAASLLLFNGLGMIVTGVGGI